MSESYEQDDSPIDPGLLPGATVAGRFRVVRKLGEGGMGAVYAAVNISTNRSVALKVMHPEYAAKKDIVRRFKREAKAATAINHPNVIEVLDVVETETGETVMVMELLQGEPLDALLDRRGALPLGEVCRIMVPVVAAVGAAHARGIVHRDLKPENIFLSTGLNGLPTPKVLDFGIAKILDPSQINERSTKSGATRTGSMLGTPHYMSVEQACGERDIDHRTDVWSVGVILYVMLAGRRPYDGDNFGQILKALMTHVPTPLSEIVPGLPHDVAALVDRCMRKPRDQRPVDLREVYAVLGAYAGDTSVSVPPCAIGVFPSDLASSATLSAASIHTSSLPIARTSHVRPSKKKLALLVGVAVAAMMLGVVGVAVWTISASHFGVVVSPDQASSRVASTLPAASSAAILETPDIPALPNPTSSTAASNAPPSGSARTKTSPSASAPPASTNTGKTPSTGDGKPPKTGIIDTVPY